MYTEGALMSKSRNIALKKGSEVINLLKEMIVWVRNAASQTRICDYISLHHLELLL